MNPYHRLEIECQDDEGARQYICVRWDSREAIDLPIKAVYYYNRIGLMSWDTMMAAVLLVLDDFGVPRP